MRLVFYLCCIAGVLASRNWESGSRQVVFARDVPPSGYRVVGPAPDSHRLDFIVALKQRQLDFLESTFWDVSDPLSAKYGKYLTPQEIQAIVSPPVVVRDEVCEFFREHCDAVSDLGDHVRVSCSVAAARTLLSTSFHHFENTRHMNRAYVVAALGEWSLPSAISRHVDFVDGVSYFPPHKKPALRQQVLGDPTLGIAYSPQTFYELYNIGDAVATAKESYGVASLAADQGFSTKDLEFYASQAGVPNPIYSSSHEHGSAKQVGFECDMDVQLIASIARGATPYWWDGKAWLYDFTTAFLMADDVPQVVSISYAYAEDAQCEDILRDDCASLGVDATGYMKRVNVEFQKIGLRGVSVVSGSGDAGAVGDSGSLPLNPVFPASSQFITTAGATYLQNPEFNLTEQPPACADYRCASGGTEAACSFSNSEFTTGGGFSAVFPRPAYQDSFVEKYLSTATQLPPPSEFNATGRGFPDVAMLGHGIIIVREGELALGAGTSASTPEFAGILTLLNTVRARTGQPPIGFANPLLYHIATQCSECFRDITVGSNRGPDENGYDAQKGWDPVTGLGAPDYTALADFVASMGNKPALVSEIN